MNRDVMKSLVATPVIVGVVVLLVVFLMTNYLAPYPQSVLMLCGINMILAASLNLVNGFTGQFSLGHAGFMAVGAYASAAITTSPAVLEALSFLGIYGILFISLLVAGVIAAFFGLLVGIPSLRLRGDYLAIVTLGFGEIIRIVILNMDSLGGARGMIGIQPLTNLYWVFGVLAVTVLILFRWLRSSRGLQFMAVRDDETATLAMGLSTTRIKVTAFVVAAFFAGLAGGLFAHNQAYLNPSTFNYNLSFQIVAMVVLGGMGSLSGSLVAAFLLTLLLEVLRPLKEYTGLDLRMVIYALILIVLMLTRPQGIFGRREIWELKRS